MADDKSEISTPKHSEVKVIPPAMIDYTNHRGERGRRAIAPIRIYHGSTAWHPEEQYLLDAWDMDKRADRTFALKNVHSWDKPATAVDVSIAKQLQNSMERNARMVNRLKMLRDQCNDFEPRKSVIDDIDAILKDEDF